MSRVLITRPLAIKFGLGFRVLCVKSPINREQSTSEQTANHLAMVEESGM